MNAIHDSPPQPLGGGVEDLLARPIDQELRYRYRRLEGDLETHPRPVLGFALQRVLDMLRVLLRSLVGIPHQPVRAPVVFEHLSVDDAGHPDGDLHMVWAAVGVAVDDLGPFVHRGPGRRRADICQRLQNRLRRRVVDNLSRCLYGHYYQTSNAAVFADGVGQLYGPPKTFYGRGEKPSVEESARMKGRPCSSWVGPMT